MPTQPDILVVLSDQQRPDSCGVFGQRLEVTPVLDALASDGVAFEESFTVQPLCGPSRSVLQTGRMPTSSGCWRNGRSLPQDVDTLATRLGDLGYWTGYIGKWHLASDGGYLPKPGGGATRFATRAIPPERRGGFSDLWVAADALEMTSGPYQGHLFDGNGDKVALHGYRVDAVTDIAIEALQHRTDDRPRLLFVSYLEPHHQNNRFRSIGPKGWASRFSDHDVPGDLVGRFGDWRWNYSEYLACCASIDANLGRLIGTLRTSGELDDTLVVYSSDHGSHFRTRNLEYKRTAHDASIRVPLVLRGPGFRGGERIGSLTSNLDLVPTLVAAAGGGDPGLPGAPLQSVVAGDVDRDAVLIQVSESQIGRALRTKDHTYAVRAPGIDPWAGYKRSAAGTYRDHLLYDLRLDPAQRHNLTRDPDTAALRADLGERLCDEIERVEGARPRLSHGSPRLSLAR